MVLRDLIPAKMSPSSVGYARFFSFVFFFFFLQLSAKTFPQYKNMSIENRSI